MARLRYNPGGLVLNQVVTPGKRHVLLFAGPEMVLVIADDPASDVENATVLAAPVGAELGTASDSPGVSVFATASDTASGADTGSVLAILTPTSDAGAAGDAATVLAAPSADDPASGSDTTTLTAAVPGSEVTITGDGAVLLGTLTGDDPATAVEDAMVTMLVTLTAGDDATAVEDASVFESIPEVVIGSPMGTGVRRREQKAQYADLHDQDAQGHDLAVVAAALTGAERAEAGVSAMIRRYPGPAMVNSFVLAAIAALEDAA